MTPTTLLLWVERNRQCCVVSKAAFFLWVPTLWDLLGRRSASQTKLYSCGVGCGIGEGIAKEGFHTPNKSSMTSRELCILGSSRR